VKKNMVLGAAALTIAVGLSACGQATPPVSDPVKRGEYLVTLMACSDCHTPGALIGKPDATKTLGGSDVGFFAPEVGTFYGPNLTPDKETGLGNWSEAEIVTALRTGARPDGRQLAPMMPWMAYAKLTDEDAAAIAAYLKTVPAVSNKAPGPFGPGETPTAAYQTVVFPEAPKPAAPSPQ
jgi:mono/diheme cytochrome c family protein